MAAGLCPSQGSLELTDANADYKHMRTGQRGGQEEATGQASIPVGQRQKGHWALQRDTVAMATSQVTSVCLPAAPVPLPFTGGGVGPGVIATAPSPGACV